MELPKAIITDAGGKITVKYDLGVDLDADLKKSVSIGVFIEVDKSEVINEAIKKLLASGKIPDWLKKLLGVG